ncbi:MAG: beta-propeller domain-containing protein [Candidatus Gracilibacteria bacterium]|jgi:uncharacterized secreted protein with C-terminal beta-propeller domain|nr:beta-propeller domain-containing protein [Candidatus Gracilibacteria bacterium]
MKKIISLSLLSVLCAAQMVSADFNDIYGNRAKKAIQYLESENVIKGFSDDTFKPEKEISRAEFLKIILKSQDDFKEDEECTMEKTFSDVDQNDWYYPYVCYGVNNDILEGYSDSTFKPNQQINFVESAKIIANVFDMDTKETEQGEWYEKYIKSLNKERVIPGTVQDKSKKISRGEMSEIVWGIKTGNEVNNAMLGDLPKVNSCEELKIQISKFQKRENIGYGYRKDLIMEDTALELDMDMDDADPETMEKSVDTGATTNQAVKEESESADEFSTTNIQEFGVDEADIIKNDGSHIFMIKDNTIRIVRAYPSDEMEQAATITLDEGAFRPKEMYLDKDRLVIVGYGNAPFHILREETASRMIMPPYYYHGNDLKVFVFDVADRTSPKQIRSVAFDGDYVSSRKIGDNVYVVANKYRDYYMPLARDAKIIEEDFLPKFYDSSFEDEKNITKCGEISYVPNFTDTNYLIIASIDIRDLNQKVNRKVVLGSGDEIYSSTKNLYITRPANDEVYFEDDDGNSGWRNVKLTNIYKFALNGDNIEFKAKGVAEGRVLSQFSMSEHGDTFRIATQKGYAWGHEKSSSGITILDKDLKEIGKIEGIAPGENMKSVRFMGNRAYLVTFKTVDPLFVIDLKDPKNPEILGKLKIPGWSDYLHPYDENHLIGFGREVDESIDADKVHSDNAVYYTAVLGMKISIFDVTDLENPKETHKEVIGYRGTQSEVLENHKALLFDKNKGILAFPIYVTENKNKKTGYEADIETVFQGAYIYDISLDDGFKLRGKISHYKNDEYYKKSGEYFYGNPDFNIKRIIYIGDKFYTISENIIKALSWDKIKELNSIELDAEVK